MNEKNEDFLTLQEELIRAKIRNVTAQAAKTELKTKITKRDYVKISEVKKKWADNVSKVRAKLLSWPSKLAGQLENVDAVTANEILKQAVNAALKELAEVFE